MKEKIRLSDNHKRVVSVVLKRVEKSIDEINGFLNRTPDETTYFVLKDITDEEIENKKARLREIKGLIQKIYDSYYLNRDKLNLSQIINARKTNMWTMLEDCNSTKLKGYGEFQTEISAEFDSIISALIELTEKI